MSSDTHASHAHATHAHATHSADPPDIPLERILEFWAGRASMGERAGTEDYHLTRLERAFIRTVVPAGSTVCDLGCGNAFTLCELASQHGCRGVGVDASAAMVEAGRALAAGQGVEDRVAVVHAELPHVPAGLGDFDAVLLQRCLICQGSRQAQRSTFRAAQALVRPGGVLVMLECSIEGNEATNALRALLSLPRIEPPWHTLFLHEAEVLRWQEPAFRIERFVHVSSTYHFVSRVLYARQAGDLGEPTRYDGHLNTIAMALPQEIGNFGPVKAWVWRRHA